MKQLARLGDKLGSLGVITAALGCSACFPALGALGATLGLGFLSSFEGLFINKLLPLFAAIALITNLYGWYLYKDFIRGLLALIGPIFVLLTLYPLWKYGWSTYLFYSGLGLMIVVSILDVVKPPSAYCPTKPEEL